MTASFLAEIRTQIGETMKDYKKMVIVILIIIAACVSFTVFFIQKTKKKDLDKASSATAVTDALYKNSYIYDCSEENISFICDSKEYSVQGKMEEAYTGIADIEIKNGRINKISIKPNYREGVIECFDDTSLSASEIGSLDFEDIKVPVYDLTGDEIKEYGMDNLVIGEENLRYVLDEGRVCSIIRTQVPQCRLIRVIIKNGSDIFYPTVALDSTDQLVIEGQETRNTSISDVNAYMTENNLSTLSVSSTGSIRMNGRSYEGDFRIVQTESGLVTINILPVEDYVRYVIPSEMPSSFSKEALKTQAVCARTFAYSQMKNDTYAAYGANLDDSTDYQVYNASGSAQSCDQAVEETENQVIVQDGQLITCYYYSTSAGMTEDMEVWGSDTPGYIHKVESIDDNSPYYSWNASLDISGASDEEYGGLKNVEITAVSDSGYVLELTTSYEKGTRKYNKELDIRRFLGQYINKFTYNNGQEKGNMTLLPSAAFQVSDEGSGILNISGRGFGHGIGMSQYGAQKLAAQGYTYQDILSYYYNNITIQKKN